MGCHIQIPRLLLRPFVDTIQDGKKVHYLDFQDFEIKEGKINDLGSEEKYYFEKMETFLAREIEGKVGEIFARLRKVSKRRSSEYQLTIDDAATIRQFFIYTMLRGRAILKETKRHSTFAQFLRDKDLVHLILSNPDSAFNLFEQYSVNILFNKTDIGFLIPSCCIYSLKTNLPTYFFIMPISPKCCILLASNDSYLAISKYIDDATIIKYFNNRAYAGENTDNKDFIAGNVEELERIRSTIIQQTTSLP